jgi:FtsP/CotA-like multicopper oxidase with cupredoxin domain
MTPEQRYGTWTRRQVLGAGLVGAYGVTLGLAVPEFAAGALRSDGPSSTPRTPFVITPFVEEVPIPPELQPVPPFATERGFPAEQVQAPAKYYEIRMQKGTARIIPDVETEIWGYNGIWPGPTIRARAGEPVVVRQVNDLDEEVAIHLHGAHPPAESDGYPADLVDPGAFRDYGYPNVPAGAEAGQSLSTIWYHDHAQDITGQNVYRGLAGFYLVRDDFETGLIGAGTLPGDEFDLALVLQDRVLNADGSLFFDPLNHDGFLGDVFCVNGKAQPFVSVRRRQYRLRVLNGSNARFYMLRLSTGAPFLAVGVDSALLPTAVQVQSVLLAPAERVDLIADFRNVSEVFLENIVIQNDGRGPGGKSSRPDVRIPGVPLLKFVVNPSSEDDNVHVQAGDVIRPLIRILPEEVVATRTFVFGRSQGAWTVNDAFFDPDVPIAQPTLGTAERWIIKNDGGGWWHPIHIHQELHQLQRFNGRVPPPLLRGLKDTTVLGPNDTAELFIKFRDYPGRWVFHCHNLAHEDMAMMARFDVVGG